MKYLSNLSEIPEFSSAAIDSGQIVIPRPIIDNPQFNNLKSSGIFLYMLLLNRLRAAIDFELKGYDENGNTFVCYPIEELMEALQAGKSKVISLKKKLKNHGLIEEVRQGSNLPNRIYLTDEILKYY
ncbi:replication initiator protein A [Streptococcus oralis subsp. tigurinus]|uniref:replication initiator protein A n=1 Tax=Streptococcus oralis TaxID=1303 RepID=UPI0039C4696B